MLPTPNFKFTPSKKLLEVIKNVSKELVTYNVVALDPGETTGVARFDSAEVTISLWQLETKNIGQAVERLTPILITADCIRQEDYKVYSHKRDDHVGMRLHTSEVIGCIETIAFQHSIPVSRKLAAHAKGFWTDDKLKMFDAYPAGIKHARDALRHLLLYMCWPNK